MSASPTPPLDGDLRSYLWVLWRRKWLIVMITVLGGIVAGGVTYLQTPEYTSSASILLQSGSPSASLLNGTGVSVSAPDVATQIEVVTSAPVQRAVSAKLHVPAPGVAVSQVGATNVIQIAATNQSAAVAAQIANAYAHAYINFRQQQDVNAALTAATAVQARLNSVQAQIASVQASIANGQAASGSSTSSSSSSGGTNSPASSQLSSLESQQAALQSQLSQLQTTASLQTGAEELMTPATVAQVPSSPQRKRTALIGLVAGLGLAVGGVLLADALDDRIRSTDDLARAAGGLPLLGTVPAVPEWRKRKHSYLASMSAPTSLSAEAYRQLRTSLQFLDLDRDWKLVQLTSAVAGEGKTTTATNLAVMLAESGQRTILVDADLRAPRANEFFGLPREPGLTNVLLGKVSLQGAVQRVEAVHDLRVLACGPIPPNPAEVIAGQAMRRLLDELRGSDADVVVLDTPPILPVADALSLAPRVDATVAVVQAGRTSAKSLDQALQRLDQVNGNLRGLVLNSLRQRRQRGYAYGYYYHHARHATEEPSANGVRSDGGVPSPGITTGAVFGPRD